MKKSYLFIVFMVVVLSFIFGYGLPVDAAEGATPAPAPALEVGDFKMGGLATTTVYYKPIIRVADYPCEPETLKPLVDPLGNVLIKVCDKVYKRCLMEGSCSLDIEGKITAFNYHSEIEGVRRFTLSKLSRCPFGFGSSNQCLDPFYTVAADPKFYNEGDVIFVPLVLGLKLPTGEMHSGFFVVRDSGEAIVGSARFDFFTGFLRFGTTRNPFSNLKLDEYRSDVVFYKVTGDTAKNVLQMRRYPGLPEGLVKSPQAGGKPLSLDLENVIEEDAAEK